ncbi:lectin-like domain-containing protein [Levilactobacillus hammesii]|nr:hypothetical protein [Levilactobacillus hammesii]
MLIKILVAGLMGLLLGGVLLNRAVPTFADENLENALGTTPQGIRLSEYFEVGTVQGEQKDKNQAKVIDSKNEKTKNTQVVKLTDGANQVGSIWSTEDNLFDLDHEQTISMWLYFGNRGKPVTGEENEDKNTAGDGMAFVLQNDPRKTAAVTEMNRWTIRGETLGVWGLDKGSVSTDEDSTVLKQLATSAIQRSWALEFDTHLNAKRNYDDLTGLGDSFDSDTGAGMLLYPHIASNYPAEPTSYTRNRVFHTASGSDGMLNNHNDWRSYISLNHEGLIQGKNFAFLSNGAWHHLTLRYVPQVDGNPETGQMTYTFNDKDVITGAPQDGESRTVTIDKKKIVANEATSEKKPARSARWGFTGATGMNYENNLVVFDQIPDLVDVSAQAEMMNLSQNKQIHEGDTVEEHDQVQLNYSVQYNNGRSDWHDVVASLKLPRQIHYLSGTISCRGEESLPISPAELSQNTLTKKLKTFTADHNQVEISLKGEVTEGAGAVTTVPTTTSNFNGTEAVAEATIPGFRVIPVKYLTLHLDGDGTQTVDEGDSVKLSGSVQVKGETVTPSDLRLHVAVGDTETNFQLDDQKPLGQLNWELPANLFTSDKNDARVWVTDSLGHQSEKVPLTVLVGRLKVKNVTPNISFKGHLTGYLQTLPRQEPFSLTIEDTRRSCHDWHLDATASPLVREDQRHLAGQLVYVDHHKTKPLLNSEAQRIMNSDADHVQRETQLTAGLKEGLLLRVDSDAVRGDYTGSITWMLCNTP